MAIEQELTSTVGNGVGSIFSSLWGFKILFLFMFLFIIIATLVGLWLWGRAKYPLSVIVYQQRGDTFIIDTKRKIGRYTTPNDNREVWMFKQGWCGILRRGLTIPPQHYEYVLRAEQGMGIITLLQYGNGQFKVLDPRPLLNQGNFVTIDIDDMNWKNQEHRSTTVRRAEAKERWEKMFPYIVIVFSLMMFLGAMVVTYNYAKDSQDKSNALSSHTDQVVSDLAETLGVTLTRVKQQEAQQGSNPDASKGKGVLDYLKPS